MSSSWEVTVALYVVLVRLHLGIVFGFGCQNVRSILRIEMKDKDGALEITFYEEQLKELGMLD